LSPRSWGYTATRSKSIVGKGFPEYQGSGRKPSILAPFAQIIQDWLNQDNFRASWIFHRLKSMGYTGGYDTVKDFVRPLKEQQVRIAYIRFETKPGLQAQIDWADFQIRELNGTTSTCICSSCSWAIAGPCMPSLCTAAPWRAFWTHTSVPSITWGASPPRSSTTT
jgi:hypothetical protein